MPISELDIFTSYNVQRFTQFGQEDCANWYIVQDNSGKKKQALYPTMGRKHITFFNQDRFIFDEEPRTFFKSIDFLYVFVGSRILRYDRFYNVFELTNADYDSLTGAIWFAFLPVGTQTFVMITAPTSAGRKIFVIQENATPTMDTVTDSNAPQDPLYVAAFGDRFVVSDADTPTFFLSKIDLDGNSFDPATCFSFGMPGAPLFARSTGKIKQFGVLHNQLYIFSDFVTDVWANIPTQIEVAGVTSEFPWKLNVSYNFDYGIADPESLDIDFGMMAWLAQNSNGLVSFMASNGQQPQSISNTAINVLLQESTTTDGLSPFLSLNTVGFLYQYENTIFYRVSAGKFLDFGILDLEDSANCIEYNFATKTWHRCIEVNGERNRIKDHVFFNNKHLVTVEDDTVIYEMAGNIYFNELYDLETATFQKYPMRYEAVTKSVFIPNYAEFITDYVEIDFVFGDKTFVKSSAPFDNTIFIVSEESTEDNPIYLITEDGKFIIEDGGNTPTFDDNTYNALFKPHIELFFSDDGGISFVSADVREFSQLGVYRWRMRWYELGASRNRVYKLICVSSAPIVVLGGVQNMRLVSGGAN